MSWLLCSWEEGLVLDGDEIAVVPVQDQDVQSALLSVDDVLPLPADLGRGPIRIEQLWRGHCGVEQDGDEVPGLLVMRAGSRSQQMILEWNPSSAHLLGAMRSKASMWSRSSATTRPRLVRVSSRFAE